MEPFDHTHRETMGGLEHDCQSWGVGPSLRVTRLVAYLPPLNCNLAATGGGLDTSGRCSAPGRRWAHKNAPSFALSRNRARSTLHTPYGIRRKPRRLKTGSQIAETHTRLETLRLVFAGGTRRT